MPHNGVNRGHGRKAETGLDRLALTLMHPGGIFMHMRTTINIDDGLLKKASEVTGVTEKTALVRLGLEALVRKAAIQRLIAMEGTMKHLKPIRRRRFGTGK
jgi:Arc/MetJ family transcription regulator